MKKSIILFYALLTSIFMSAQIPNSGLVGWWPFNGNSNDESGNGLNAISNNGTFISDRNGVLNSAVALNGVDQMINLPSVDSLNTDTFSINFWTLANSYSIHNIVQMGNIGAELRWSLFWSLTQEYFSPMTCAGTYGNGNTISNGVPLSTWNNLCFVNEGRSTKFYLNGILIGQQNTADSMQCYLSNMSLFFGGDIGGGAIEYYNGNFDDIGIWSRALTDLEVNQIFSMQNTTPCASSYLPLSLTNDIVGWYPFCGNANDESGNNNNGTANGAILTADRFGSSSAAYSFNANIDAIDIPSTFGLQLTDTFSISVWVKPINSTYGTGPNYHSIIQKWGGNGDASYMIALKPNGIPYLVTHDGINNSELLATNSIPFNQWTNIVVSQKNDSAFIYINGYLDSSRNGMFVPIVNNNRILIGKNDPYTSTNGDAFEGDVDDIGIWKRNLSAQDVIQIYNAGLCFQTITVTDTLIINANLTSLQPLTYQNSIKIYPNPSSDHITVDNGANYSSLAGYTLRIDNSLGQTVHSNVISQQIYTIDLSTWTGNGVYFVYLINLAGHAIDVRKIVIQ
ncbi:LamG-like jellyroll fold domain-containing protein [Candidatus Pollutiaquabacter sp.]|uniref:LamG-like jellyroll fold domain-containing protein n=1 Tax=Candidatus Pollutiaquabacter sp. TaxID=3416354 RepID=UPI003CBECF6A|nr:hypothetical protein [Bacteroidota bacterium]